ncbi:MAG: hypothetical protein AB7I04_18360 [Pseudomonadales bacterium]
MNASAFVSYPHPLYGELRVKRREYCCHIDCFELGAWVMTGAPERYCHAHGPGSDFYQLEECWVDAFAVPAVVQQLDLFGAVRAGEPRRKWVAV